MEQDLGAADSLHCCVVDEEWCVIGLAPPGVDDDLLGFVDVQGQVVGFAPVHWMPHLISPHLIYQIKQGGRQGVRGLL